MIRYYKEEFLTRLKKEKMTNYNIKIFNKYFKFDIIRELQ